MTKDLLLPSTDAGVAIQVAVTAVLAPLVVASFIRRRRSDLAWLTSGVVGMWIAFMALRTIH